MKISVNTIRHLNQKYAMAGDPAPEGVEKLAEKIGAQLGAIEEIIDVGSKYEGIYIVKVVECGRLENSDHLNKCLIDDGGKKSDVERDEKGLIQIITGAPNVHAGMVAVWLPPGSTVPSTIDKDPFVLESRPLRGAMSHGMLASQKELGIGDAHEGLLEIDEDVAPGTPFAEKYNLVGDKVLDIENKMFTHRPDCFGSMGVAREIAGIQNQAFKSPDWYLNPLPIARHPELVSGSDSDGKEIPKQLRDDEVGLKLEVKNELPELVPRFCAVTMSGVEIKPSPVWLQIELAKVGLRPINNIVDLTNYYMLETGQPLHAYDYDKVVAQDSGADHATIVVRKPNKGEKILLLNGKEVEPKSDTIMIATREKLIGIGGVMGGGDTEVDENTKNIILEAANFDMYSIRRISMALGLFTDSVTRFNKGQSPLQNKAVIAKIVEDIQRLANGKVVGEFFDLQNDHVKEMLQRGSVHPPVELTAEFIDFRLGLNLSADEIKRLLEKVEFKIELPASRHPELVSGSAPGSNEIPKQVRDDGDGESEEHPEPPATRHPLLVTAPFWRTDIEIPEDVVEEVGRLYGYDKLPLDLPKRDLTPASKDPMLELKAKIRNVLSKAGANEVLTYSFVHGNLLDKVGQDRAQAFQLANALSPDLQFYRLSLTPSLLEKIHPNIKAGHDEFALFEIGKSHVKEKSSEQQLERYEGVPKEFERVAFVFAADKKVSQNFAGAAYYEAQRFLLDLLISINAARDVTFEPLDANDPDQVTKYYETGRAATIRLGGKTIGRIGEYKTSVCRALKLPDYVAGFELGLAPLLAAAFLPRQYSALPRFPKVEQDICLKVAAALAYQDLESFVSEQVVKLKPENSQLTTTTLDIYQRDDDKDHKQITFRLSIASYERTLTDGEVSKILDQVAAEAKDKFEAERI